MRFKPESDHGANAGLGIARDLLDKVKAKYPGISYGDLWTLAGVVAVEEMGGPKVKWSPGRVDATSGEVCPPDGRLPDATQGANHLRDIFYKMGFNDQEIVALAGAHCFGRCHTDRSGFSGPWTRAPTSFSNLFFKELLDNKWAPKKWAGPKQYADPTGDLMMLPADMALIEDPKFKTHVERYAKDGDAFEKDFAKAFSKLLALGVKSSSGSSCTNTYFAGILAGIVGLAASSRLQN
jgi:cytochrome c peroxidase